MEAKGKLRKEEYFEAHCQHMPSPWFQSKVNQIILLRNLQSLNELDYKTKFESGFDRRREVIRNGIRSISLFALSGDITLIDTLQSRMRFREYDIIERYREDEFRVALTHLRDVSPSEVQKVLRRFADAGEFLKLKCLLLRIQSQKDLKKETLRSTENVLHRMGEGEVRILSI